VEDAAFTPDNTFYFTIDRLPPIKVLCVTSDTSRVEGSESVWFQSAMGKEGLGLFHAEVLQLEQVSIDALDSYAVVVLLNVGNLEKSLIRGIESFIRAGGGLFLAPADRLDAVDFNRLFEGLTPGRLVRKRAVINNDFVTLSKINVHHPILRHLNAGGGLDFGAARFRRYWSAVPFEGSDVIMRFDSGDPALLERTVGKGRILLFASSLDTRWNDLPMKVSYLPLMQEIVRYLSHRGDRKRSYKIGEAVPLPSAPDTLTHITDPRGRINAVLSTAAAPSFFTETEFPGFYKFSAAKTSDYFAVNVPATESDLSSVSPIEIQDAIVGPDTNSQITSTIQSGIRNVQIEKSQKVWWWLMLTALILGLGETFLANRTYR
jgi:hypothetical protein